MRKIFLTILTVVVVVIMSSQAYALDTGFSFEGSKEKLTRGAANLADALVEVPGTMMRKSSNEGVLLGLTVGMVEGVFNTIKRALAGSWEVATFPIPVPENYEPILPDPEFLNVN